MQHAGFLIRLVAYIIDDIIITIGSLIIMWVFGMMPMLSGSAMSGGEFSFGVVQVLGIIVQLVWGFGYLIYFWTSSGQTPGKMIMGVKVVAVDGGPVTVGKAILRIIGYFVSGIVIYLGFLWIIWDKEKQGWHDKIAGTYVVKV